MSQMTHTPTFPISPERNRERLHAEIAAFAEAQAGTDLDLAKDLERAGIETIRNENNENPLQP